MNANDKLAILATLREEYERWERLLTSLREEIITTPRLDGDRSIKDDVAHLWAWQQRTIARAEAALYDHDPQMPQWPAGLSPEAEDVDQINAWIYETNRTRSWSSIHQDWREGFLRLLDLAELIPEADMMTVGRYHWLPEYALAFILAASGEHHQEHREDLAAHGLA